MRNVLWIMTDQHRADCLGCMGHPAVQTPNLDRLAAEGMAFDQAFCQSPVCMASRAALLTGRSPQALGVRGMDLLRPWETTTAEVLRRAGYHTGAFGKLHLTPELYTRDVLGSDVPVLDWRRFADAAALPALELPPEKEQYGFCEHLGCDDACQGRFHEWLRRRGEEPRPRPERLCAEGPADLYVSPYSAELDPSAFIAERTADFIRRRAGGGPWMAFCSFIAPHHPFAAPAEQLARYDPDALPLPAAKGGVDLDGLPERLQAAIGETDRLPEAVLRRIVQHYLAAISQVDDGVGRLLQTLEETGQGDETIVLFVADHGEFLGNHGLLRKPSFQYDETLRVPLLLRLPEGPRNRRVAGLVECIDLHPTLLGLLGVECNPGVQGRDWSDCLRREALEAIGHEAVHAEMHEMSPQTHGTPRGAFAAVQTLRTRTRKLCLYPTLGAEVGQLFDLANDPDESVNRYHDPAWRAEREALTHALVQRLHRNADPLPLRLTQW
jgi:arylsulfatase A-like enzyme